AAVAGNTPAPARAAAPAGNLGGREQGARAVGDARRPERERGTAQRQRRERHARRGGLHSARSARGNSSSVTGASANESRIPTPVVEPIARSAACSEIASVPNTNTVVRQERKSENNVPSSSLRSRALSTRKTP